MNKLQEVLHKKDKDLLEDWLINNRVDINAEFANHNTPLTEAIGLGSIELVQVLLEAGANCNIVDGHGNTPLLFAIKHGYKEIVKFLVNDAIDKSLDFNKIAIDQPDNPIVVAITNKYTDIAKTLVEAGADVKVCDKKGLPPLVYASAYGYTDLIDTLIEKGAEVNNPGTSESTPLVWAIRNKHSIVAKKLIQAGANYKSEDSLGLTPLMWAVVRGDLATVKVLVELDPSLINVKNKNGDTALGMIFNNWNSEMFNYLTTSGGDVALIQQGRVEIIDKLMSLGYNKIGQVHDSLHQTKMKMKH